MKTGKNVDPLEIMARALGIAAPARFDPSAVTLTDEEREAVLSQALGLKVLEAEREHGIEWRRGVFRTMNTPMSPKQLGQYALRRFEINEGHPMIVDNSNREALNLLCYYFTRDPRFEAAHESYSLDKGIMLQGDVGRGKTSLMKAFCSNQFQPFVVVPCRDIAGEYQVNGPAVLEKYAGYRYNDATGFWSFGHKNIGYLFDDLGTEEEKKHYGNGVNVLGEVISNAYDKKLCPFYAHHVTTNLNGDEIQAYYGKRVRSRCRQKYNVIELGGEDRRK